MSKTRKPTRSRTGQLKRGRAAGTAAGGVACMASIVFVPLLLLLGGRFDRLFLVLVNAFLAVAASAAGDGQEQQQQEARHADHCRNSWVRKKRAGQSETGRPAASSEGRLRPLRLLL